MTFNSTPMQGAMATLIFSIGMIIGRLGAAAVVPQKYLFHMLLGTAGTGIIAGLILPFAPSIWAAYGLFLLLGLACSALWPSSQSYCTDRMPFLDSTVVYIILSCAGTPGCGIMTWLLGKIGDNVSLKWSVLLVPLCLLVYVAVLVFERLKWRTSKANS